MIPCSRALQAYRNRNKPPVPGKCVCPPDGLDYNKIAAIMGAASAVCTKCGKVLYQPKKKRDK